jgi:hypothetical protein
VKQNRYKKKQKEKELGQIEAEEHCAYSLLCMQWDPKSQEIIILGCLRIFLDHISLLLGGTMKERYNYCIKRKKRIKVGYLVAL